MEGPQEIANLASPASDHAISKTLRTNGMGFNRLPGCEQQASAGSLAEALTQSNEHFSDSLSHVRHAASDCFAGQAKETPGLGASHALQVGSVQLPLYLV